MLRGGDTFRRASSHPDAKSVGIIALTADDFMDHQLSMDSGINYHVTKIFSFDHLYSAIKNIEADHIFNEN
jgi:CheY-like chemotaxis protein